MGWPRYQRPVRATSSARYARSVMTRRRHATTPDIPHAPLHRRARQRDRGEVAGPLGRRAHLLDARTRTGAARRGLRRGRATGRKLFVLDMFPYPSGAGLHVGHPLGYIGTDVYARFMRMSGHNVLHAMGYDAFGLPAEQYAVQTGQHPRVTTEANIANMRRQLRALGLGHDSAARRRHHRRRLLPLDAVDLPADLQLLVRRRRRPGPPDRRAAGRARGGHPRARERRATPTALAWPTSTRVEQRAARRLVPPRVPRRGAGELVPRARHRARQRGGHRRRPQRARQLPGLPASAEAVDAAHHRVRRPAARRPRPARLARVDQADAAQLDRPQRRRARCRSRSRSTTDVEIEVFTTRPDTLFGATYMVLAPEHPLVDVIVADRVARRDVATTSTTCPTRGRASSALDELPAEAVRAYREFAAQKSELERQAEGREKTGVFTGAFAINPTNGANDPDLHRRLRADGLRHRGDHGGARARRARLRVRATSSSCPIVAVIRPPDEWLARRAASTPTRRRRVARGVRRRRRRR